MKHLKEYANYMKDFLSLNEDSFVIDIGSNDGTCLSFFKDKGINVLGIDPAEKISQIANENGIHTLNEFFNIDIAKEIKQNFQEVNLITSHNAWPILMI